MSGQAERARLQSQLSDAQKDMTDTRFGHSIDMQSAGYDRMAENANTALKDIETAIERSSALQQQIVNDMLDKMSQNASTAFAGIQDIILNTHTAVEEETANQIAEFQNERSAMDAVASGVQIPV